MSRSRKPAEGKVVLFPRCRHGKLLPSPMLQPEQGHYVEIFAELTRLWKRRLQQPRLEVISGDLESTYP